VVFAVLRTRRGFAHALCLRASFKIKNGGLRRASHKTGLRPCALFARIVQNQERWSSPCFAQDGTLRLSANVPEPPGATQKNKAALSPAAWHPPIPCPCRLVAIASAFASAAMCVYPLLGERA